MLDIISITTFSIFILYLLQLLTYKNSLKAFKSL